MPDYAYAGRVPLKFLSLMIIYESHINCSPPSVAGQRKFGGIGRLEIYVKVCIIKGTF